MRDEEPRTATSTSTQLLSSRKHAVNVEMDIYIYIYIYRCSERYRVHKIHKPAEDRRIFHLSKDLSLRLNNNNVNECAA